jgi:hypothetical protein
VVANTAPARGTVQGMFLERRHEPRPLIYQPAKLGLIWSAKGACTKVVAWHFKMAGLLHAARFYHEWPHEFREKFLYESVTYRRWVESVNVDEYLWVQFVRDPVKRAISSYRHCLLYGYADELISKALERPVSNKTGYSLIDFLTYLSSSDLNGPCDIHVKYQCHPLSERAVVINIDTEDMFAAMNRIESRLNLHQTEFAKHPVFKRIDDVHNARPSVNGVFDPQIALTAKDTRNNWPITDANLPREIREWIESVYRKDVELVSKDRKPAACA